MGLLPCLNRGSDRWWLPCNLQVTEVLGELLLQAQPGEPLSPATHRRILGAMLNDPPLLIFAALQYPDDRVEPAQLVDWLTANIAARLVSGEAYLGEPPITAEIAKRWIRLRDHFRTLPIQAWIDNAALWLEVTGPAVPPEWQRQWPALADAQVVLDEVERRLEPAIDIRLLPGLQVAEAEVENDRHEQQASDEQQVGAKQQPAVATLEHYAGQSQASGTSR